MRESAVLHNAALVKTWVFPAGIRIAGCPQALHSIDSCRWAARLYCWNEFRASRVGNGWALGTIFRLLSIY